MTPPLAPDIYLDHVLQYGALGIVCVVVLAGLLLAWRITGGFLDGIAAVERRVASLEAVVHLEAESVRRHTDKAERRILAAVAQIDCNPQQ